MEADLPRLLREGVLGQSKGRNSSTKEKGKEKGFPLKRV